jgi:photosystem II stability/assembly factor-like uncharacterized protein
MIGPFRASRTVGAVGVPSKPNVFYIGVNNGGVWKTDDFGRTWVPIFDDQPTGSIGTLAIAPSNPDVIYVGSGEGLQRPDLSTGDGIYKSIDGGKTWEHLGLRDGEQIGAIIVHPRDPNRLLVAVVGHPYGPNTERGVFRSTDGGKTFEKVLYKNENTGAFGLVFDPKNPDTIYATLWESRQGPWENAAWSGPGSGLYKSTDGGTTWKPLTNGLPTFEQGLGRIAISIAPSDRNRIYLIVESSQLGGVYRSDDAGASWRRICTDTRVSGRNRDLADLIKVHPKNKDIVFAVNVVTWKSTDGGMIWSALKGAPGGDDYQGIWINPDNPDIILMTADQGATITVNGGRTWSSWYNQPTAQFYHVSTDNQWPYWVYSGQQESGSAGVASRSNNGAISFREFITAGVSEYGYVAPDPLNLNIIYGGAGRVTKYDRTTGQVQNVGPEALRSGKYRTVRTAPILFSPVDPHMLYYAANVLFKTTNGGHSWDIISPDLTRETTEIPESVGVYLTPEMAKLPRRGVIYTIAPSYKNVNVIWVGTDDGFIQVTRDGGKTWKNVTPPEITSWSKVSIMDAGHFDTETAYAAVNRIRCNDQKPHIYRTHDGGKTWKEIVSGLTDNAPVNAVREDPVRKGLLFCGTERAIHVSFNDGEEWLPLRLNMPATSMRDLVVKDDDLVVGTHGRSFWILDDITPLRQIDEQMAAAATFLFKPQLATRVRWNVNTDTPLPPEEPVGKNPPDGAILNYWLKTAPSGAVTLEIFDSAGKLVRRFSSADKIEPINEKELSIPSYWVRQPQPLPAAAGMQRFVWDLHYPAPEGPQSYPIAAIYKDTAPEPKGPWVMPGEYTVKLTTGGKTYMQPLKVRMDPRIKTPAEALKLQYDLSMQCYEGANQARQAQVEIRSLRAQIKTLAERLGKNPTATSLAEFDKKIAALEGAGGAGARGGMAPVGAGEPTLGRVASEMGSLMGLLQGADMTPTTQATTACEQTFKAFNGLMATWKNLKTTDLEELNASLRKVGQPALILSLPKKD